MKDNAPVDDMESDAPDDDMEYDAPDDNMEYDAPDDNVEYDVPDDNMENGAPEGGALEVDEQSPDEDERKAMQSLRAPEGEVFDERYPDEVHHEDESQSVLEIHHLKNRTFRPPDPRSLLHRQLQVEVAG